VAQFHDAPDRYLGLMRDALPLYDRLHAELVLAGADLDVTRLLDLGVGTGETSRRCLAVHEAASVVGIDGSQEMLDVAGVTLGARATLICARLQDPLPAGPFELVVSALAVHHLDGPGKADLFGRIRTCLAPGGRFVMADVVIADGPVAQPTPLEAGVALPDRLDDLLDWLRWAGLRAQLCWAEQDLAVVAASAALVVTAAPRLRSGSRRR